MQYSSVGVTDPQVQGQPSGMDIVEQGQGVSVGTKRRRTRKAPNALMVSQTTIMNPPASAPVLTPGPTAPPQSTVAAVTTTNINHARSVQPMSVNVSMNGDEVEEGSTSDDGDAEGDGDGEGDGDASGEADEVSTMEVLEKV